MKIIGVIGIILMVFALLFVLHVFYLALKHLFKKNSDKKIDSHQEYFWFILPVVLWSLFFLRLCLLFFEDKKIAAFVLIFLLYAASAGAGYFLLLKWGQKEKKEVHH